MSLVQNDTLPLNVKHAFLGLPFLLCRLEPSPSGEGIVVLLDDSLVRSDHDVVLLELFGSHLPPCAVIDAVAQLAVLDMVLDLFLPVRKN